MSSAYIESAIRTFHEAVQLKGKHLLQSQLRLLSALFLNALCQQLFPSIETSPVLVVAFLLEK